MTFTAESLTFLVENDASIHVNEFARKTMEGTDSKQMSLKQKYEHCYKNKMYKMREQGSQQIGNCYAYIH